MLALRYEGDVGEVSEEEMYEAEGTAGRVSDTVLLSWDQCLPVLRIMQEKKLKFSPDYNIFTF